MKSYLKGFRNKLLIIVKVTISHSGLEMTLQVKIIVWFDTIISVAIFSLNLHFREKYLLQVERV